MNHEPTDEELRAAVDAFLTAHALVGPALTAANAVRDKRIRLETIEMVATTFDGGPEGGINAMLARVIRELKDKVND